MKKYCDKVKHYYFFNEKYTWGIRNLKFNNFNVFKINIKYFHQQLLFCGYFIAAPLCSQLLELRYFAWWISKFLKRHSFPLLHRRGKRTFVTHSIHLARIRFPFPLYNILYDCIIYCLVYSQGQNSSQSNLHTPPKKNHRSPQPVSVLLVAPRFSKWVSLAYILHTHFM